jgi:hypothetical protein
MSDWKERRVNAMNRVIKKHSKVEDAAKELTEHFLDEYNSVMSSEARNKAEYKIEKIFKS